MPIKRCKCLSCNNVFNAFLFKDPKVGLSLQDYPCPNCKGSNKEVVAVEDKEVKGWKSIEKQAEQKPFLK